MEKQQWEQVGEAFVGHYYQTFDSNRQALAPLYRQNSMLTFEGERFMDAANIINKLTSLPFQKVVHQTVTIDTQPIVYPQPNGILVFVSGNLLVDDNVNPMKFSQTFTLFPDPAQPGNYWVHNDMFRLNYG
eukprot:Plantae.Rhodophyta-Rhodochaete_pulchella.ctg52372.p1 GENE.Plantae.Rhodophyta-Rhodochaete_pulchella.ctg52372~~Plantae.Rhodophyta-Rhodochaete_pulchella.ctg52372.p1  ORF type:complete len:139 (-),score=17.36 Plantae.Rhodophyta-Rhodochaete_pulchella.ctg52372:76-468(-)